MSAYAASLLALLALCFWLTSLDFGDFRPESPAATYVLWGLSTCVVVGAIALGFLLFRNLLKLYVERRANVIGSRLKTKLVAGVLALGLAPIALHVYFSIALLNRNFDKWFSQPTVDVLRSAERLVESTTARSAGDLRKIAYPVGRPATTALGSGRRLRCPEPDGPVRGTVGGCHGCQAVRRSP